MCDGRMLYLPCGGAPEPLRQMRVCRVWIIAHTSDGMSREPDAAARDFPPALRNFGSASSEVPEHPVCG